MGARDAAYASVDLFEHPARGRTSVYAVVNPILEWMSNSNNCAIWSGETAISRRGEWKRGIGGLVSTMKDSLATSKNVFGLGKLNGGTTCPWREGVRNVGSTLRNAPSISIRLVTREGRTE